MTGSTTPVGTQARGWRRREALLSAAVELLESGGLRALSHRAVAERAGVPLGATTYYFQSRSELAAEAFGRFVDNELDWARRHVPRFSGQPPDPGRLAGSIVTAIYPHDEVGTAKLASIYELCAQAGREPSLRPLLARWTDGLVEIAIETLRRAGYPHEEWHARLLVALIDGLLLEVFEQAPGAAVPRATDTLTHALSLLRPSHADSAD